MDLIFFNKNPNGSHQLYDCSWNVEMWIDRRSIDYTITEIFVMVDGPVDDIGNKMAAQQPKQMPML